MTRLALRNPIGVLMFSLALALLGFIGLSKLPLDLFPKVDVPVVMIGTLYPGASPEIVERTVSYRIERAVATHAADALLLKVNQVGTVTEALQALRLARAAGWKVVISARSGETEDNWLADLAVGFGGDQIKIGSITRSERLAKYNRLLQIEAELRPSASGPEPEA